ncbi:MAG: hypothetical protein IJX23_00695 [Clostridia bacterium]|nr:hypothetical protein [Clostridia bacterium]
MKLGRFLLSIVVIGLLVGLGSANGQECAGLFGAIVVGFAFCLFGDLLEFLGGFGRVLFWLCVTFGMFCAFAASYQDLFPQPQDIHSIQDLLMGGGDFYSFNILERIFVCGAMPMTVATLWLATLVDYYDAPRGFIPVLPIGGAIIGGVIGLVIQLLSVFGAVPLMIAMIVVTILGTIPLFKFYKKHGWIMDSIGASLPDSDDDYIPKRKPSRSYGGSGRSSGYSSSYGSSTSGYSEGDSQLDYYMDDIASDNSRSRNLPFDCSIRSDVSFSHYGDDAYFTVDFTLDTSGCSAETQSEYDMMVRDAQDFQEEVMNDLFREGKNLINRLKQKYPDFCGVNFQVKVGNINQY